MSDKDLEALQQIQSSGAANAKYLTRNHVDHCHFARQRFEVLQTVVLSNKAQDEY